VAAVTTARRATTVRALVHYRWRILFGLVGVAGVALRVWAYRSLAGTPNADEAIVGLMARHILHGEFSTFYWGQTYGGSQEALLTAPVFLVAGTTWFAVRLVPIVLSAVAALLVWRVGRRTIGEPAAGVAGAVLWIWPPFNIYMLTHQQGFYASNVVYCALLLLLALRIAEQPDVRRVGIFGLVLGLAFWQTAQIVPVAVGVIAWIVWKQPRALRQLPVAVPLAVLGALPWIVWNATHGWESLAQEDYGSRLHGLRLLASPFLPMTVGLRAPFSADLLLPAVPTYAVYVALAALFVVGAVKTRHRDTSILYVVAAVFPFVYVLSTSTAVELGSPRYLVVLTPILALLAAQVATTFWRAAALLALALLISAATTHRMNDWFGGTPRPTSYAQGLGPRHIVQSVPRDLGPLVTTLDRLGLDRVFAEYWVAYPLTFDTDERIIASENVFRQLSFEDGQANPPFQPGRRVEYNEEVRRARHGFVFYRSTVDTVPIVPALERHGWRRIDVGPLVVYAPPD